MQHRWKKKWNGLLGFHLSEDVLLNSLHVAMFATAQADVLLPFFLML